MTTTQYEPSELEQAREEVAAHEAQAELSIGEVFRNRTQRDVRLGAGVWVGMGQGLVELKPLPSKRAHEWRESASGLFRKTFGALYEKIEVPEGGKLDWSLLTMEKLQGMLASVALEALPAIDEAVTRWLALQNGDAGDDIELQPGQEWRNDKAAATDEQLVHACLVCMGFAYPLSQTARSIGVDAQSLIVLAQSAAKTTARASSQTPSAGNGSTQRSSQETSGSGSSSNGS